MNLCLLDLLIAIFFFVFLGGAIGLIKVSGSISQEKRKFYKRFKIFSGLVGLIFLSLASWRYFGTKPLPQFFNYFSLIGGSLIVGSFCVVSVSSVFSCYKTRFGKDIDLEDFDENKQDVEDSEFENSKLEDSLEEAPWEDTEEEKKWKKETDSRMARSSYLFRTTLIWAVSIFLLLSFNKPVLIGNTYLLIFFSLFLVVPYILYALWIALASWANEKTLPEFGKRITFLLGCAVLNALILCAIPML